MFSLFQSCRNQLFCVLAGLLLVHCVAFAEDPNTPQQVLDLQKAASTCLQSKDTAGAIEKYQAIIQGYPGSKYALDAQSRIIMTRINIWSEVNSTHRNDDVTTVYLADSYNHTGYAQVIV